MTSIALVMGLSELIPGHVQHRLGVEPQQEF